MRGIMSNDYIVRDIAGAGGEVLKRGTVVVVAYYDFTVKGFPELGSTTWTVLSYPECIIPSGSTEWLGENVFASMRNSPHYILKQRGMGFEELSIALLQLSDDDPHEVIVRLDEILSGLKMSLEQWRGKVRSVEDDPSEDIILYKKDGIWQMVTTRSTSPRVPETEDETLPS
jgi:hypothetical protein